ncbi:MAG: ATP-binding protein [Pseudomonadota bacterium]
MIFGIRARLAAAFALLAGALLVCALLLSQWSFERGLLSYVATQEAERLQYIADSLAREFDAESIWREMTDEHFERLVDARSAGMPPRSGRGRPPPPHARPGSPGRRPPGPGTQPPKRPTALLDTSGTLRFGDELDALDALIRIDLIIGGETVGSLASPPPARVLSVSGAAFAAQQRQALSMIGIVGLGTAIVLAIIAAGWVTRPLRQTIKAVDQLSSGDYDISLPPARHDELGDLMRNVNTLSQTLDANRHHRQQWFANASHELRTPIAVLRGEIEAIRDGVRVTDADALQSLLDETNRLSRLVDDLYELARSDIGALRYEFASEDIGDILECVTSMRRTDAEQAGLHLTLKIDDSLPPIKADAARLQQALQNLINNALAYTDAPGRIEITAQMRDGNCRIIVEDSAPGLAIEHLRNLFEPLWRADSSRNRKAGGAGLGLAIVRNIAQAHGGDVQACASNLGGLRIELHLPLSGAL